ncbi:MAG: hypothetical protein HS111_36065 [Kofleriaceae bacterium]|nr:hypothetical protein [Kofleriaceae bacterium]
MVGARIVRLSGPTTAKTSSRDSANDLRLVGVADEGDGVELVPDVEAARAACSVEKMYSNSSRLMGEPWQKVTSPARRS